MNARELFRMGLEWCGALLFVVVALPLLAMVLFVLRFAVLGLVALGIAAVLVGACASGRVREWARDALGPLGEDVGPTAKSR